jgi:voltage-gated potassium channel
MALMIAGIGVVLYFVSTLTAFIIEGDLQDILRRRRMKRRVRQLEGHLILCGVGRMGRAAAGEFLATEQTFVVLDRDPAALARLEHDHPGQVLYIQGDAVEDEVLLEAGVERARGLVTSLSSDQDNVYVTISAKALNPELQVVSKAIEATAERKLLLAGADRVVLVNTIGGLRLASEMIRPEVTNFLDHMLRDHKRTLRVEEIPVHEGSAFVGKQLAESEIRRHAEVLVIAVRDTAGAYHYNPSADYSIGAGETLIVIGNPRQVRTLRAL